MIFIKSVECLDVRDSYYEYYEVIPEERIDPTKLYTKDIKMETKIVHGRRYKTAGGKEIVIGMAKEVQETIGLSCEAWEELEERLEGQERETTCNL